MILQKENQTNLALTIQALMTLLEIWKSSSPLRPERGQRRLSWRNGLYKFEQTYKSTGTCILRTVYIIENHIWYIYMILWLVFFINTGILSIKIMWQLVIVSFYKSTIIKDGSLWVRRKIHWCQFNFNTWFVIPLYSFISAYWVSIDKVPIPINNLY